MEMALKSKISSLYQKEGKKLLNYIKKRVGDEYEAEDIFQNVFYQAINNMNTLEPVNNILGWLYKVAKNKIIDKYRRKERKNILFDEWIESVNSEHVLQDPLFQIEDIEIRYIVEEAMIESIEELPEDQKFVFIQNEIEGKTFKELGKKTGISINTLLSKKRYAVLFLRERLFEIKEMLQDYQ